jgi:hypothetical protein
MNLGGSEHTSVEFSSCPTVEAAVDGTETLSFDVPLYQSCCAAVSGIVNNPVRAFNRFDFSFLL